MSVIKNEDNIKSNGGNVKVSKYEIPAVIRKDKEEISFEKALIIALIIHPLVVLILMLSSLIFALLGIELFKKPEMKPKDIEFVLVEKEAPPIDKNTKNRADKDSQAGGKHDPKRAVSLPQSAAPKAPAKKPTPPAKKPAVQKPQPKPQPKQQTVAKPQPKPQPKVEQVQQPAPKPVPKTPAPRPQPKPVAPTPTPKLPSDFNIPIPKSAIPQIAQPTTAPVTAAPQVGGSSGGATSTPSPSFSPTTASRGGAGSTSTSGGGGRFSNATGSSSGNVGNPGPGNPKGAPGIDAIREPDFGPYMKELQRRIKMNWDPPKGNESKRVVLLFSIARDGRLLNVSVHRSSGLPAADKAAIDAVKLTAPFRPLPPDFKGNSVDIQFTFDYNVFGIY